MVLWSELILDINTVKNIKKKVDDDNTDDSTYSVDGDEDSLATEFVSELSISSSKKYANALAVKKQ